MIEKYNVVQAADTSMVWLKGKLPYSLVFCYYSVSLLVGPGWLEDWDKALADAEAVASSSSKNNDLILSVSLWRLISRIVRLLMLLLFLMILLVHRCAIPVNFLVEGLSRLWFIILPARTTRLDG